MLTIRPARWPGDIEAVRNLDTGFETDRVYRPVLEGLRFDLLEESVAPPLRKRYPLDLEERDRWQFAAVAEWNGAPAGFAAAEYAAWNRRAILWHLYVTASLRGRGIGAALLSAAEEFALLSGARCLWLETQNVNAPAVRFYRSRGFALCGFDATLYDPTETATFEVGLFFARPAPRQPAEPLPWQSVAANTITSRMKGRK